MERSLNRPARVAHGRLTRRTHTCRQLNRWAPEPAPELSKRICPDAVPSPSSPAPDSRRRGHLAAQSAPASPPAAVVCGRCPIGVTRPDTKPPTRARAVPAPLQGPAPPLSASTCRRRRHRSSARPPAPDPPPILPQLPSAPSSPTPFNSPSLLHRPPNRPPPLIEPAAARPPC